MKIGVVSTLFPGRRDTHSGVFVRDELDSLARYHGCDFKVIAPLANHRAFGERRSYATPAGYPVIRPFVFAFSRWFMQRRYPASLAFVLGRNAGFFADRELVHAHNAFPDAIAAVGVYGSRLPVVVTVHGSDINHFAGKPDIRPAIVRALGNADLIIAVSDDLRRKVRDLGVRTDVKVIPNGIDTSLFRPGPKDDAARELGLDPARPRILFAGNFLPVKGIEYLVRAMPAVLEQAPGCELVLLGARPGTGDRGLYTEPIRDSGVDASVTIVERVAHNLLPVWYRAADVFVLPSVHEGFGLVAAEALACGRPVVATRCGGPEDIVKGHTGYLVPPRDPEALADAVIRALQGEGIAAPEQIAGYAHSAFSYESVAENIHREYERILGQRDTGRAESGR